MNTTKLNVSVNEENNNYYLYIEMFSVKIKISKHDYDKINRLITKNNEIDKILGGKHGKL